MMAWSLCLLAALATVDGFLRSSGAVRRPSPRPRLFASSEVEELRTTVDALSRRLEAVERELATVRDARVDALEAELAAVRRSARAAPSSAAAMLRQGFAARAATPFRPPELSKFEPRTNDAFVDDTLEDLLEIGGDPTFLEEARPPSEKKAKEPFVWDGVIDETAHFDDDPDDYD